MHKSHVAPVFFVAEALVKIKFSHKLLKFCIIFFLVTALHFFNCGHFFENRRVENLMIKFLTWYFETFPTEVTSSFVAENNSVGNFDRPAIERTIKQLHLFDNKLSAVNKTKLTFANRVNCKILSHKIRTRLFELERWQRWQCDPLFYVGMMTESVNGLLNLLPDSTLSTEKKVVARIKNMPAFCENARRNLKLASSKNLEQALLFIEKLESLILLQLPNRVTPDPKILTAISDDAETTAAALQRLKQFLTSDSIIVKEGFNALNKNDYGQYVQLFANQKFDLTVKSQALKNSYDQLYQQLYQIASEYFMRLQVSTAGLTVAQVIQKMEDEIDSERLLRDRIYNFGVEIEQQQRRFIDDVLDLNLPTDYAVRFEWETINNAGKLVMLDKTELSTEPAPFVCRLLPVSNEMDFLSQLALTGRYNKSDFKASLLVEALPLHFYYWQRNKRIPLAATFFPDQSFLLGWKYYFARLMIDAGYGGYDPKLMFAVLKQIGQVYFSAYAEMKFYNENLELAQLQDLLLSSSLFHQADLDGIFSKFCCTPGIDFLTCLGLEKMMQLSEKYVSGSLSNSQKKEFLMYLLDGGPIPLDLIESRLVHSKNKVPPNFQVNKNDLQ